MFQQTPELEPEPVDLPFAGFEAAVRVAVLLLLFSRVGL
jgi:hypothetical protein